MSTLHEVTTLEIKVFSNAAVYAALEKALPEAGGRLIGAFASDIGELSRVLILREFDDANALVAARQKLLLSTDPLGCAESLVSLRSESYALFPFLPQPQPGAHGRWYEFRTYGLRQGLLGQTIGAWQDAVPARHAMSPLVGAFTALDGEQPRFLNIWAYESLEQRSQVRAEAVKQGVWPPKGGPASLTTMTSWVCAPTPFSPMT
ncbi:NIPSNAP family protein [Leptothrix discophora]|uniref:NIPSNAP family protein n=1 Tax=Leptothrix discophora TaxID=89 RepID=A0ABT9FY84_LEPDI|nr:NIPSNAP family protein [Leptothrix discophora]MDP4299196.1 NIPSNAP family protein [Leptothrix discophora]